MLCVTQHSFSIAIVIVILFCSLLWWKQIERVGAMQGRALSTCLCRSSRLSSVSSPSFLLSRRIHSISPSPLSSSQSQSSPSFPTSTHNNGINLSNATSGGAVVKFLGPSFAFMNIVFGISQTKNLVLFSYDIFYYCNYNYIYCILFYFSLLYFILLYYYCFFIIIILIN